MDAGRLRHHEQPVKLCTAGQNENGAQNLRPKIAPQIKARIKAQAMAQTQGRNTGPKHSVAQQYNWHGAGKLLARGKNCASG